MSNEIVTKIKGALEAPASQQKLLDFFGDDKSKATKFKSALLSIAQNPILSQCSASSILKSARNNPNLGTSLYSKV